MFFQKAKLSNFKIENILKGTPILISYSPSKTYIYIYIYIYMILYYHSGLIAICPGHVSIWKYGQYNYTVYLRFGVIVWIIFDLLLWSKNMAVKWPLSLIFEWIATNNNETMWSVTWKYNTLCLLAHDIKHILMI